MKGLFKPRNPKKYVGDVRNIKYRSSWELKFMGWLDASSSVEAWSSEGLAIPYVDPARKNSDGLMGKPRHYYPDFIVKMRTNGIVETFVVEVKPEHETKPPVMGKSKRRFLKESRTYATNTAKWKRCREFCAQQRWKFIVLDEKALGIK